uniref:Ig-like domain-containing protein n=1 Tax=Sander lucioperca TaxID=283035 RepID=A0A8C9XZT8_SANLU
MPINNIVPICMKSRGTVFFYGFRHYHLDRCVFNSSDLNDIEYSRSVYYNKVEYFRFSSSLGKFVGYTEYGVMQANYWNRQTSYLAGMRATKVRYCKPTIDVDYQHVLTKSGELPYVRLDSTAPFGGKHPAMLVCSVYDFYPKQIRVSWIRDGKEVTSDVTSTDELADGDWYYQIHSYLEYTPRSGEKISCMVEHASLREPLITQWGKYLSLNILNLPVRNSALCFFVHGALPDSMLSVVLVPVIKDKVGKLNSSDNYRPIALASVMSKMLETVLLCRLERYVLSTDNQFGFKRKH